MVCVPRCLAMAIIQILYCTNLTGTRSIPKVNRFTPTEGPEMSFRNHNWQHLATPQVFFFCCFSFFLSSIDQHISFWLHLLKRYRTTPKPNPSTGRGPARRRRPDPEDVDLGVPTEQRRVHSTPGPWCVVLGGVRRSSEWEGFGGMLGLGWVWVAYWSGDGPAADHR